MTQGERLDFLVEEFKRDSGQYKDMEVDKADRRTVLRSLMNIRMPKQMDVQVVKIQDEFLYEEAKEKGVVSLTDIPTIKEQYGSNAAFADKISIWQGDITRLGIDAIVNAANSQMIGCFVPCHKCIDNAIHSAAGIELREECNHYMQTKRRLDQSYEEPTGSAMVTKAYNLPCKYVLHTVGSIVGNRLTDALRNDLKSCYESCLEEAIKKGIRSIAFCCISTGEFHFPNEEAARIAFSTVNGFISIHGDKIDRVVFNVFKDYDKNIYEEMIKCGIEEKGCR